MGLSFQIIGMAVVIVVFARYVGVRLWRTIQGTFEGWSKSMGVIPISLYFILLSIWFCISMPLTLLGRFLGMESMPIQYPNILQKLQ